MPRDVKHSSDALSSVSRGRGQHHGNLREELLAAAVELIAERGPRGFSLAEAARRAGVSASAPYNHFSDRAELLAALAERSYRLQVERYRQACRDVAPDRRLTATALAYVGFAVSNRPMFEVLFGAGLDKSAYPDLALAGAAVVDVVADAAATALGTPVDDVARRLSIEVLALAHGYAVFLLEGALGPVEQALPDIRRRIDAAADALIAAARARNGTRRR